MPLSDNRLSFKEKLNLRSSISTWQLPQRLSNAFYRFMRRRGKRPGGGRSRETRRIKSNGKCFRAAAPEMAA
jgi:hypothetical protein